jgi:hypothetical protein
MCDNISVDKKTDDSKDKGKKKREATSPLFDSRSVNSDKSVKSVSENKKSKHVYEKDINSDPNSDLRTFVSRFPYEWGYIPPNMAFSQPPFGMPPFLPSPPPSSYTYPSQQSVSATPPPWASELLEDMKVVKHKLQSIDKIDVNSINVKLCDLETKLQSMDARLSDAERFCDFFSRESDATKRDLKSTFDELKHVKKSCIEIENKSRELQQQKAQMDEQLTALEMQSLQHNLLFYGIPEEGKNENCQELVKKMCSDTLKNADTLLLEKAHRLGKRTGDKVRPILAKFFKLDERERVRSASFELADELKAAERGVGAQLPRSVRDARRPLYPKMEQAIKDNKSVKFVGKKLFINNVEYIPEK